MRQPHQRLERRIRVGRYPASNDALESRHRLDRHVRLVGELGLRQALGDAEGLDGARDSEGGRGHEGVGGGRAAGHGNLARYSRPSSAKSGYSAISSAAQADPSKAHANATRCDWLVPAISTQLTGRCLKLGGRSPGIHPSGQYVALSLAAMRIPGAPAASTYKASSRLKSSNVLTTAPPPQQSLPYSSPSTNPPDAHSPSPAERAPASRACRASPSTPTSRPSTGRARKPPWSSAYVRPKGSRGFRSGRSRGAGSSRASARS